VNEFELERMIVRLLGDGSSHTAMWKEAQQIAAQATSSISSSVAQASTNVTTSLSQIGQTVVGLGAPLLGFAGAVQTAFNAVRKAADMEAVQTEFGVLLQSAADGQKLVGMLTNFAATTPLNMEGVSRAAKLLLQFDVAAGDLIPTLRMLGDVAGGDQQRMMSMALAFGQMKAAGHLMGQDLMQMRSAGFNPLQEIARTTGVSVADLTKKMEKGGISVEDVTKAFESATKEGGRFHNGMEEASKTVKGLFSTMQDDIDASLREIGKSLIDNLNLKDMVKQVSSFAQQTTEWIQNLSPQFMSAAAGVIVMTGAIGLLTVAFFSLSSAVGLVFGGFNIFFMAAVAGLVALVVAGTNFIQSMGGITNTFAYLKTVGVQVINVLDLIQYGFVELGKELKDSGVGAWQNFVALLNETAVAVKEFVATNGDLVANIVAATGAVRAGIVVWNLFIATLGLVETVMSVLGIQQVISIGLWLLWKGVLLTASVITGIFSAAVWGANAAMSLYDLVVAAGATATGGWSVVAVVAKVAAWLFNAALTAMNVLLAPVTIITATLALAGLAAAFVLVASVVGLMASAAYAAYVAVAAVGQLISHMDPTPLEIIGGMISEWVGLVKEVAAAAQTDLPLAWKLARAGMELAVSQMQDLWPPLWEFIKNGFRVLADLAGSQFEAAFLKASGSFLATMIKNLDVLGVFDDTVARLKKESAIAGDMAMKLNVKIAELQMKRLTDDFDVFESDRTKKARQAVEDVRQEIKDKPFFSGGGDFGPAEDFGKKTGDAVNKGLGKELHKFDAALYGSAEAFARIAEFRDKILDQAPKTPFVPPPAKPVGAAVGNQVEANPIDFGKWKVDMGNDPATEILNEILKVLKADRAAVVEIDPADLET